MSDDSQCLVVCGEPSSVRIRQSIYPHLDFSLEMVEVEFKEDLLDALSLRQPLLCVVEWRVPVRAGCKDEAALLSEGAPPQVAAMLAGTMFRTVPAYEVFEEAGKRSPNTKFIVACHNQGYDVPKAHPEKFMSHPAVIKRMGFINGLVNMRYLAKLFTKTYAGRTWKARF